MSFMINNLKLCVELVKISGTLKTYLGEIKVTKPLWFIFFSFFFYKKKVELVKGMLHTRYK